MEKTAEIVLTGSLQAAGFIPFIYRAAARHKIKGRLSSGPFSVYIQATAPEMSIKSFYEELLANNPAPGLILFGKIDFSPSKKRFESFEISISDKAGLFDFPAPDAAPCEKCVSEMKDKNDRRAAHVFISCSLCGPRYSITERMPFRRENTPYGKLVMCTACSRETKNIKNRRYLSAINSCPQCGPSLYFKGEQTGLVEGDAALKAAKGVLKQGALLAVKGAGCFYIIADAGNDDAVSELRKRKKSEKKPFAVMAESIAVVREFAEAGSREEGFLKGRGAPVVILPKKEGQNLVSDRAAPGLYTVGAALPQSPLFALLFDEEIRAVVFTSGNMEGQPPEYINESAWLALGGIADFFLFSSIEISGPLEDSVVKPYETGCLMLRRSRGDVPVLLNLGKTMKHDVIGAGVRGDGSFCLVSGRYALVSGNHGYRDTPAAAKAYASDLKRLSGLSGFKPAYIAAGHEDGEGEGLLENACAAAPDARRIRIKNFYAQFLSALAENNYYGTAIGMILGPGREGSLFITGDFDRCTAAGGFRPVFVPAGQSGTGDYRGAAAAALAGTVSAGEIEALFGSYESARAIKAAEDRDGMFSTEAAVLMGAAAAITGACGIAGYEHERTEKMDGIARSFKAGYSPGPYPYNITRKQGAYEIDLVPALVEMAKERGSASAACGTARFLETAAEAVAVTAGKISGDTGITTIALTGAELTNTFFLDKLINRLKNGGFNVLLNNKLPPGNACVPLGQAVYAAIKKRA